MIIFSENKKFFDLNEIVNVVRRALSTVFRLRKFHSPWASVDTYFWKIYNDSQQIVTFVRLLSANIQYMHPAPFLSLASRRMFLCIHNCGVLHPTCAMTSQCSSIISSIYFIYLQEKAFHWQLI
jgi:hypothetical protein